MWDVGWRKSSNFQILDLQICKTKRQEKERLNNLKIEN